MVYLHGIGHFHPENVITNGFISELDIGSDEEWIMERVGIKTRRTSLDLAYIRTTRNRDPRGAKEASLYTRQEMGAKAAKLAMARAGVGPEDIGLAVSGTSTPEHTIPAEASSIAAALGIEAPCFDINSACSTFLVQLSVLAGMKPENTPPYILVVNPENYTHVVDYSDRSTAPLFGDGAAAAVVSLSVKSGIFFSNLRYNSNPSKWDRVKIPRLGHFSQHGKEVQGFAIRTSTNALSRLKKQASGLNAKTPVFIGHQANFLMLNHVCHRCNIPETRHWYNVVDYGNTGSAGAPSVLSQNWDKLAANDCIAMVVVGSGLTWAEAMLTVQKPPEKRKLQ